MSSKQAKNFGSSETKIPACLTPVDNRKSLSCDTKTFPRSSQGGSNKAPLKTIQIILALIEECHKNYKPEIFATGFQQFTTTKSCILSHTNASLGLLKTAITALQKNNLVSFISRGEYVSFPNKTKQELCRNYDVLLPWWWKDLKNDGKVFYTEIEGVRKDRFILKKGTKIEIETCRDWNDDICIVREVPIKIWHGKVFKGRLFAKNIRRSKAKIDQKTGKKLRRRKATSRAFKKYEKQHKKDIDKYRPNKLETTIIERIENLGIDRRVGISLLVKCHEETKGRRGKFDSLLEDLKEWGGAPKTLSKRMCIETLKKAIIRQEQVFKFFEKQGRKTTKEERTRMFVGLAFNLKDEERINLFIARHEEIMEKKKNPSTEKAIIREEQAERQNPSPYDKNEEPSHKQSAFSVLGNLTSIFSSGKAKKLSQKEKNYPLTSPSNRIEITDTNKYNSKSNPQNSRFCEEAPKTFAHANKAAATGLERKLNANEKWDLINKLKYQAKVSEGTKFLSDVKQDLFNIVKGQTDYFWSLYHIFTIFNETELSIAIERVKLYTQKPKNFNAFFRAACEKSKILPLNYKPRHARLKKTSQEKIKEKQQLLNNLSEFDYATKLIAFFPIKNWRFFIKYDNDVFKRAIMKIPEKRRYEDLYTRKKFEYALGMLCKDLQEEKSLRETG